MANNIVSQFFEKADGQEITSDTNLAALGTNVEIVHKNSGDHFKKISSNVFDRVDSGGGTVVSITSSNGVATYKDKKGVALGTFAVGKTYSAGTGLELSGTTFSVDEDFVKNLGVTTKYGSQKGMILLSDKIKIQYFMIAPNTETTYPYGGYTSNPIALVSRCHLGYDSTDPYDYTSDYIGVVDTAKTNCYLAWTQDNVDSKYPVIVIGITDGSTAAESSSEDDPTYVSGTWYYIGDASPGTSSISSSSVWSSYKTVGSTYGYDYDTGTYYSGSGSHPSSGTYKGTWTLVRSNLYKTTSLYRIA